MKPDAIDTLLEILTAGGRLSGERSRAQESHKYGNPINSAKMQKGDMQKTKEIETILRYEIDNWMRWGKRRDWMPTGFRCPIGYMYKTIDREDCEKPVNFMPYDEIGAAAFERIVVALPQQHRMAFVMHHLEKAAINGIIVIVKGRDRRAQLLGVHKSRYHEIINQAHAIVLRECMRLNPGAG